MTAADPVPVADDDVLRVGVLGARGRMGTEVCRTVEAAEDLDLVAMVDEGDWLFSLADAVTQVVDYVSGMTDRFALNMHDRLFDADATSQMTPLLRGQ